MRFPSSSTIVYCLPACLLDLLWSVPSLQQKEGDGRFDTAAIHRTGFLIGSCIWVLPSLVVQVKGVVGVGISLGVGMGSNGMGVYGNGDGNENEWV